MPSEDARRDENGHLINSKHSGSPKCLVPQGWTTSKESRGSTQVRHIPSIWIVKHLVESITLVLHEDNL